MIKNWLITGDTHGNILTRINQIDNIYNPKETALIILGDAGFNFYLNDTDLKNKQKVNNRNYLIYCVRGNHEERPENLSTVSKIFDSNVNNYVYYEEDFPNIRYFIDTTIYNFNNHKVLVLGGAYSVDKWYRLSRSTSNLWTGWFKDEQLTTEEMNKVENEIFGQSFDFVLTHTCPYSWMPTDLFLPFLDQSLVDKTMELWLEKVKDNINWNYWLFGHYHANRKISDKIQMFFADIKNIDDI